MFDSDKRRFPRAHYPCSLTVWHQDGNQEVILAHTANIGAGGLCVHLNQKLVLDSCFEVSIEFPHSASFQCKARVVRCEECPNTAGLPVRQAGKDFYSVSLEFESMDEVKQATLLGIVSDLIALNEKNKKK
ncbi:MAG: PilZ domain-containing protein [Candidatus Omnitrophica bacterium]|nr:PilZ domain-containing protein [Candidatus Omnitrophota bacterium]